MANKWQTFLTNNRSVEHSKHWKPTKPVEQIISGFSLKNYLYK